MEDFVSEYLEIFTENFLLDSWQIPSQFEREILEGFPFMKYWSQVAFLLAAKYAKYANFSSTKAQGKELIQKRPAQWKETVQ